MYGRICILIGTHFVPLVIVKKSEEKLKLMKRTFALMTGIVAIAATLTSCHKEPLNNLTNEESRIYITNFDSSANFSNYHTYSISDSVALIKNGQATRQLTSVDQAYITAVKKYLNQIGYTQVAKTEDPDLGVDVNRIVNTSTGVISYPDYWGYYGSYWDPYYWGYGGYDYYVPYSYAVYQVNEGAMSIDLLDLKDAHTNNKINVVWTGLIRGEGIFSESTADSQVKALFDQSAYLSKH